MHHVIHFNSVNEAARFEFPDQPEASLKFLYLSPLYGSCTLLLPLTGATLGQLKADSASVEFCESRLGRERALKAAARRCLTFLICKNSDQPLSPEVP